MATDFGLVVQATQRDTHVLALQRSGDALAQAGLADSGRAIEAEDGRLEVATQLEHGDIFQDTLLHFLHSIVVLVQDALRTL